MIFDSIHIGNPSALHELSGCVFSNVLLGIIICLKFIRDLCGLHVLYRCVSSNIELQKMICHKIHICNLCGLFEKCVFASSCLLIDNYFFNVKKKSQTHLNSFSLTTLIAGSVVHSNTFIAILDKLCLPKFIFVLLGRKKNIKFITYFF